MANPEQQGLKRLALKKEIRERDAEMANPEQQGLKLCDYHAKVDQYGCRNG